jgi:hypothetical protein
LLVLPFGEFELVLSTFEMIALSVPLRRVHPGVQEDLKQALER